MYIQELFEMAPDFGYTKFNPNMEDNFSKIVWREVKGPKSYRLYAIFNTMLVGYMLVDINKTGAVVGGIQIYNNEWKATGLGQLLYDKAISYAKNNGCRYFRSDDVLSKDAIKAWTRLAKRYPVTKIKSKLESGDFQYQIDLSKIKLTESNTMKYTKKTDFRFKGGAMLMQRFGPINAQKQNIIVSHTPPVKRGMWAFPYPAFDMFFAIHRIEEWLPEDLRRENINKIFDYVNNTTDEEEKAKYTELINHLWDLRDKAQKKFEHKIKAKTFWWDGPIYSHLDYSGNAQMDSWFLWTDLKEWARLANKSMIAKDMGISPFDKERGWTTYSVDHLELFLPMKAEITKKSL